MCAAGAQGEQVARSIILDTDISTDAEDVGALAVLHGLARQEPIDILYKFGRLEDP